MTGLPGDNFPAFDTAARLRAAGYRVVSPADLGRGRPGETYAAMIARDFFLIGHVGGMAMLPGWERSKGANLECDLATRLGLPVAPCDEWLALAWIENPAI